MHMRQTPEAGDMLTERSLHQHAHLPMMLGAKLALGGGLWLGRFSHVFVLSGCQVTCANYQQ